MASNPKITGFISAKKIVQKCFVDATPAFRINTIHSTCQTGNLLRCFSTSKLKVPNLTPSNAGVLLVTLQLSSQWACSRYSPFHISSTTTPFHNSMLDLRYDVISCNMAAKTTIVSSVCAPCIGIAASQCFNSCLVDSAKKKNLEAPHPPVPTRPLTATNNPHAFGYAQKSNTMEQESSVKKGTTQL